MKRLWANLGHDGPSQLKASSQPLRIGIGAGALPSFTVLTAALRLRAFRLWQRRGLPSDSDPVHSYIIPYHGAHGRTAVAGHSKWSQIKRKKAVNDQKRGQMFTKLIRELTVAARDAGGDPAFNPRLRLAVDSAKGANMPQENIDRAIKRGTGELEGVTYEEVAYEGYGPGGVALYIETLTDNQKRTVAAVRHLLDKNGGKLGTAGSVAWQFDRKGVICVEADGLDEEQVFEVAVEVGADDVSQSENEFVVTTDVGKLHEVIRAIRSEGMAVSSAQLTMLAKSEVTVGEAEGNRLLKLLEALDDEDDVQQVHSNASLDEILARTQ